MCTNIFKLECYVALLYFFIVFPYISTKSVVEQLQSAWKSLFSVFIVNALNKDEGLFQINWLEKVEHIEIAQRYTHGPSVTLTDGPLDISPVWRLDTASQTIEMPWCFFVFDLGKIFAALFKFYLG